MKTLTVIPPVEIDLCTAAEFRDQIRQAGADRPSEVLVDLSEVAFCDSSALRVLAEAVDLLGERGTTLRIERPSQLLVRMASVTGVAAKLRLVPPGLGATSWS